MINYQLIGSGWAKLDLCIDQQQIQLFASYLHDSLTDLLQATLALLNGKQEAKAYIIDEPNEYRCCFSTLGQQLTITIWQFDKAWSIQDDEQGSLLFQAQCRLNTFAGALLATCQKLTQSYSLITYRQLWKNHDLPISLIAQLQNHPYRK